MNEFSVLLNDFFVKYLAKSKGVSDNTSKNYRDTFVQLLLFLEEKKKIAPCKVNLDTLGYEMVNEFLDWLESERNVSISTRNNRLAGIKSFFQYISRCRIIVSSTAFSIACSMVASFLYDMAKKLLKRPQDLNAKVKIISEETKTKKTKSITYEGPVSGIKEALEQASKDLFKDENDAK